MNRVLTGLERQLLAVRNDERLSPQERADRLSGIEKRLREYAFSLDGVSATAMAGSILEEAHEWRDACEGSKLDAECERSNQLIRHFFEEMAAALERSLKPVLESPTPDACFDGLVRTNRLQVEVRGEFPGEGVGRSTFSELRDALREGMASSIEHESVTSEMRNQWTLRLCDRADSLLTSLDNLPPERGAGRLTLMIGDLDWHLKHIESTKSSHARKLRRKRGQLLAEWQERQLQHRLEQRFGRRMVAASERVILFLIFLVVGLMTAEMILPLSQTTIYWFSIIDAGACLLFLIEFFTKLFYVPGKVRWFRRHFLIDLIPSIPFGLLTAGMIAGSAADPIRAGRLGRLLRLPRLVRYVRLLRPLIRIMRGFGLLSRGLDRLARQYGHLLNQNVILFPNREELASAHAEDAFLHSHVWRLSSEIEQEWERLLRETPEDERCIIAGRRLAFLETGLDEALRDGAGAQEESGLSVSEIPAEVLIDRMLRITPQEVEASLGESLVQQLSRNIRLFARLPLRWLPIIRRLVPPISEEMTDSEVVAAASKHSAREIQKWHSRFFTVSDLYGTVTPSQFVDRVGSTLVKSSMRPAYRLVMFGAFLGMTQLLLVLTPMAMLKPVEAFLTAVLGPTVLLMGSICLVILIAGIWLQRIAREATEFYERSVQAQFLALTEVIRTRRIHRGTRILFERALRPLWSIRYDLDPNIQLQHFRRRVIKGFTGEAEIDAYVGMESTLLLYHDWLDGAMFTEVDTRTSSQLLGNPAIRQIVTHSDRVSAKEEKALGNLDLVRQKSLFGGPYLWFNFITRAIAHSVAQQIVEYNQRAIPLDEIDLTPAEERKAYELWLTGNLIEDEDARAKRKSKPAEANYLTTAFTALHFLDNDEARDREIAHRFGPEMLERLQRDRQLLLRKIFGTYPKHDRAKEERVVNLYSIYSNWLSGGRALLLPWSLFLALVKVIGAVIAWGWRSVQEIRDPERRAYTSDAATAPFRTAVRKIDRIRGPIVHAATRLRMLIDPEYLQIPIPGQFESPLIGADVESDIEFLQPDPAFLEEVEIETKRSEADVRRLESLIDRGMLERVARIANLPEQTFSSEPHIRALMIVYNGDYHGLRGYLSSEEILKEVAAIAKTEPQPPLKSTLFGLLNKHRFRKFCKVHPPKSKKHRAAIWRAIVSDHSDARRMLRVWDKHGSHGPELGEKVLATVLLHPNRIIEQLLTLRVIQTLSVLDVLNYREHIFSLGRYADDCEEPGSLLEWNTMPGDVIDESTDSPPNIPMPVSE